MYSFLYYRVVGKCVIVPYMTASCHKYELAPWPMHQGAAIVPQKMVSPSTVSQKRKGGGHMGTQMCESISGSRAYASRNVIILHKEKRRVIVHYTQKKNKSRRKFCFRVDASRDHQEHQSLSPSPKKKAHASGANLEPPLSTNTRGCLGYGDSVQT